MEQSEIILLQQVEARLSALENFAAVHHGIDICPSALKKPTAPFAYPRTLPLSPVPVTPCSFSLAWVVPFPKRWYAKRKCYTVSVSLTQTGGHIVDTTNWSVLVRLVSAEDGNPLHPRLLESTNINGLRYRVTNGMVSISGLRFLSVSSKQGGNFQLQVSLSPAHSHHDVICPPIASGEITIVSERLKTVGKVDSILELGQLDKLTRVPGIGNQYASRLHEHGITTILDLADLTPPQLTAMFDLVRKEKGALTMQTFRELHQGAKMVVAQAKSSMTSLPLPQRHVIYEQQQPLLVDHLGVDYDLPFEYTQEIEEIEIEPMISQETEKLQEEQDDNIFASCCFFDYQ